MSLALVERCARLLQVEQPRSWRNWLLRLFVLPAAAPRLPAPPVQALVQALVQVPPPAEHAIRRSPLRAASRPAALAEVGEGTSATSAAEPQVRRAAEPSAQAPRASAPASLGHPPASPGADPARAAADSPPGATHRLGMAAASGPAPMAEPPVDLPATHASPAPLRRMQQLAQRLWARWLAVDHAPFGAALEHWAGADRWQHGGMRLLLLVLALAAGWVGITTPLTDGGQALFFGAMLGLVLVLRRVPGNAPTLALIALALLTSCRYGWWRLTQSINLAPGWEMFLGAGLLLAEGYAFLIMVLGFLQTARPLNRPVLPIDLPREQWPAVDVYIPTFNEPLSVLGPTVLAARDLDWPAERLTVWVLDDGNRPEVRAYAEAAGVRYLARADNRHAKAGNLNHALAHTRAEYIAIFDCDHMPVRGFLVNTLGWLLRDPGIALVQTPHHFFSPDPFERNLETFRRVPNEGVLFYGLVQDGNDVWNASFFCGSCAVLRRQALEDIGGVATETVTEDAHTALKLHRRGWRTAYLNQTFAAGLATESLAAHVRQRIRWARGMAQIFRLDNPLLGRGLNLMQRLCYANAMLHFFYGLPRLVFLTAPLAFLYFELHVIHAQVGVLLLYLLPHLVLPHIVNAHIAGPHRHSFWSELYETVLAWYVALPTTLALIDPHAGRFDVTSKGGLVERTHLDWRIARPYFLLMALNAVGLGMGLWRYATMPGEWGTISLNVAWTVYNLLALGAAIGVAREQRQMRRATRVHSRLSASLLLPSGRQIDCETEDWALTGIGLQGLPAGLDLRPGSWAAVRLYDDGRPQLFPAHVVSQRGGRLALHFDRLSLDQQAALIRCTFTRQDAWQHWQLAPESDRTLHGLVEIAQLGVRSYGWLLRQGWAALRRPLRERWAGRRAGRAGTRAGAVADADAAGAATRAAADQDGPKGPNGPTPPTPPAPPAGTRQPLRRAPVSLAARD